MTDLPLVDRPAGQYPIESLPEGWVNVEVTLNRPPGRRYEILNLTDHLRYQQEPLAMTAAKCFGLVLFIPLYFAVYTAFHLARVFTATIANRSMTLLGQQIWALVRTPFYILSMQCAAIYGIFKPLEGRAMIARLESQLHDGKNRGQVLDCEKEPSFKELVLSELVAKEHARSVFVAPCMQPILSRHPIIREVQNSPAA